jgi:hypothetical protein
VFLISSQLLVWGSIPANLGGPALDVLSHSKTISLALNLLPFAGIAFLWFIAEPNWVTSGLRVTRQEERLSYRGRV